MRHYPPPSFSLHRIAADMTTRIPFRGGRGRGRRSFSDETRPSSAAVSGDSHFHSVRHTNSTFRRHNDNNDNFNYRYSDEDNNAAFHSRNNINNNRRHSNFDRNPNPNPNPNRAPVSGRSRPPDYRIWEYAKDKLPPSAPSERFLVLSYNILAEYLATNHQNLYFHIPYRFLSWDWRKRNILFELGLWSPDILCFQEVDKFHELEEDLRQRGYSGIWKMRTGEPVDGCAIFWRTSKFKLVHEECIEFNKLAMRDNVAQICVLESLIDNHTGKKVASSESTERHSRVVICNIHVLYNPRRGEIKLGQVRVLLERAQAVAIKWDDAPVVLCGDFNCTPKSPLYNFISEQKIDISQLERDKVSGQASAVIHSPPRQSSYHASPTMVQNTSDGEQSVSVEIENGAEKVPGNLLTSERLSLSSSKVLGDLYLMEVSDKGCNTNDSLDKNNTSGEVSVEMAYSVDLFNSKENTDFPSTTTENSKDEGYSNHSHGSRNDNGSSQSADEFGIEFDQGPESAINDHGSGLLRKKHVLKDLDACDQSTKNCSNDRLSPSVDDSLKGVVDNEDLNEDAERFMSELNDEKDAFPLNLGDLGGLSSTQESEVANVCKSSYDRSVWTPMEVATATGNANNTVLEHSLKLISSYTEVKDHSGTRDLNGEPWATSYNRCFRGTVDYIWRSEGLRTVKVLAPISKEAMLPSKGFPTKKWGSDHIALVAELAFTK